MKLLYDEHFISMLFTVLIAAAPVAAAIGFLIHRRAATGGCGRGGRVLWAVLALAGPANYGLWHLYNAIENHWGLDKVKPLLINVAIFIALGIVIGLILRFLLAPGKGKCTRPVPNTEDDKPSA